MWRKIERRDNYSERIAVEEIDTKIIKGPFLFFALAPLQILVGITGSKKGVWQLLPGRAGFRDINLRHNNPLAQGIISGVVLGLFFLPLGITCLWVVYGHLSMAYSVIMAVLSHAIGNCISQYFKFGRQIDLREVVFVGSLGLLNGPVIHMLYAAINPLAWPLKCLIAAFYSTITGLMIFCALMLVHWYLAKGGASRRRNFFAPGEAANSLKEILKAGIPVDLARQGFIQGTSGLEPVDRTLLALSTGIISMGIKTAITYTAKFNLQSFISSSWKRVWDGIKRIKGLFLIFLAAGACLGLYCLAVLLWTIDYRLLTEFAAAFGLGASPETFTAPAGLVAAMTGLGAVGVGITSSGLRGIGRIGGYLSATGKLSGNDVFKEPRIRTPAQGGKFNQRLPLFFSKVKDNLMLWLRKIKPGGLGLTEKLSRIMGVKKFSGFHITLKLGNLAILFIHLLPLFAVIALFFFSHWPGSDSINHAFSLITYYYEQISAGIALAINHIQVIFSLSANWLAETGFFNFLGSNIMPANMLDIPFFPFKAGYMQVLLLLIITTYFILSISQCQVKRVLLEIRRTFLFLALALAAGALLFAAWLLYRNAPTATYEARAASVVSYRSRNPSSSSITSRLFNLSELTFARRSFSALMIIGALGGWILMRMIPGYSSGGNISISAKCWSWVSIILLVSLAVRAISWSAEPGTAKRISWPSAFRESRTSLRTFSSAKRRILFNGKGDIFAGLDNLGSVVKRGVDMFLSKLGISVCNYFFRGFSGFKHLKREIYHNSGIPKAGLPVADGWVYRYIIKKISHLKSLLGYFHYKEYTAISNKSRQKSAVVGITGPLLIFLAAGAGALALCCLAFLLSTVDCGLWTKFAAAFGFGAGAGLSANVLVAGMAPLGADTQLPLIFYFIVTLCIGAYLITQIGQVVLGGIRKLAFMAWPFYRKEQILFLVSGQDRESQDYDLISIACALGRPPGTFPAGTPPQIQGFSASGGCEGPNPAHPAPASLPAAPAMPALPKAGEVGSLSGTAAMLPHNRKDFEDFLKSIEGFPVEEHDQLVKSFLLLLSMDEEIWRTGDGKARMDAGMFVRAHGRLNKAQKQALKKFAEITDKIFEDEYKRAKFKMPGYLSGEIAARAAAIFEVAKVHAAYNWAVYKKDWELLPPELAEAFAEIPGVMAMAEPAASSFGIMLVYNDSTEHADITPIDQGLRDLMLKRLTPVVEVSTHGIKILDENFRSKIEKHKATVRRNYQAVMEMMQGLGYSPVTLCLHYNLYDRNTFPSYDCWGFAILPYRATEESDIPYAEDPHTQYLIPEIPELDMIFSFRDRQGRVHLAFETLAIPSEPALIQFLLLQKIIAALINDENEWQPIFEATTARALEKNTLEITNQKVLSEKAGGDVRSLLTLTEELHNYFRILQIKDAQQKNHDLLDFLTDQMRWTLRGISREKIFSGMAPRVQEELVNYKTIGRIKSFNGITLKDLCQAARNVFALAITHEPQFQLDFSSMTEQDKAIADALQDGRILESVELFRELYSHHRVVLVANTVFELWPFYREAMQDGTLIIADEVPMKEFSRGLNVENYLNHPLHLFLSRGVSTGFYEEYVPQAEGKNLKVSYFPGFHRYMGKFEFENRRQFNSQAKHYVETLQKVVDQGGFRHILVNTALPWISENKFGWWKENREEKDILSRLLLKAFKGDVALAYADCIWGEGSTIFNALRSVFPDKNTLAIGPPLPDLIASLSPHENSPGQVYVYGNYPQGVFIYIRRDDDGGGDDSVDDFPCPDGGKEKEIDTVRQGDDLVPMQPALISAMLPHNRKAFKAFLKSIEGLPVEEQEQLVKSFLLLLSMDEELWRTGEDNVRLDPEMFVKAHGRLSEAQEQALMKFAEITDKIFEDEYNWARLKMTGGLSGEALENAARAAAIFAVAKIHAAYNWAVYKNNRDLVPPALKEIFDEMPDVMAMAEQNGANKGDSSSVTLSATTAQEETVRKDVEKIRPRAFKHSIFWQSGLSLPYNWVIPKMLYRFINGDVRQENQHFADKEVLIIGLETILTAPLIFEQGAKRIVVVDKNKAVVAITRLNLKELSRQEGCRKDLEWTVEQAMSLDSIADIAGIQGHRFDSVLINLRYYAGASIDHVINKALVSLIPLLRYHGSMFFFISSYYYESRRYCEPASWSISLQETEWLLELIDQDSEFLIDCDQYLLMRISRAIFYEALGMPGKNIIHRMRGYVVSLSDARLTELMQLCKQIPIKNRFLCEALGYSRQEDLDMPDLYYVGSGYPKGVVIGFTGTRMACGLAGGFTGRLARLISKKGGIIAACFVPGIDMAAHVGAFDADGFTIAAVPDILKWPYLDFDGWAGGGGKENKELLLERRSLVERILINGCFVSEHTSKQDDSDETRHRNVYRRDRIVSGLSDVVIVIEGEGNGGTVDTALRVLLQGKIVYLIDWRQIEDAEADKIKKGAFEQLKQLKDLLLNNRELGEFGSRIKIFPSHAINASDWEEDLIMEIMKELQHDCQLQPLPDPR